MKERSLFVIKSLVAIIAALSLLEACQSKSEVVVSSTKFNGGISQGVVNSIINESSGLVASINNPATLWTHNDSGGQPAVFLLDETGALLWTVQLEGIENRDWEDIAIGKGPDSSKNYLYIGEIGDNGSKYNNKYLYRIEEPKLDLIAHNKDTIITFVDRIAFTYPDGIRDAETLLIDPNSTDFYIVSKREEHVNVYLGSTDSNRQQELKKIGSLPISQFVGGDISVNGNEIILKNYKAIYYWNKNDSTTSIGMWLVNNAPEQLTYKQEPQGETIAWKRDGSGYFTLSESRHGEPSPLLFYKRN